MGAITTALQSPVLWGVAGAFIYGAPQLSVCIFTAQQAEGHWVRCSFEFSVSLIIGAIAAGAFAPWAASSIFKSVDPAQARVIAATIGLLANPIAPRLIDVLSGKVIQMLKGQSDQ